MRAGAFTAWRFAANFCAKFVKRITSGDESTASAQTRSSGFPMLNGRLINQASEVLLGSLSAERTHFYCLMCAGSACCHYGNSLWGYVPQQQMKYRVKLQCCHGPILSVLQVSILRSQEDRGQRFAFRAQLWLDDSLPG